MSVNVQDNNKSAYTDSSNALQPKEPEPVVTTTPKRSSVIINEPPENVPHTKNNGGPLTAEEMDQQRKQNIAYEYLCHLEESKVWIQACINEDLPPTTELEEGLRNGVYLAKLAHFMAPSKVPLKRIYDNDQTKYKSRGLHFRHTDNLNLWFQVMEEMGFPRIFYPETTDIYDKKNMPRTIYCLHALSLYLFKLGMAPQIQDLYGKVNFTEEEISAMRQELDKYGIQMPTFSKIGGILANELSQDDAALHAAIIAVNEAIESQVSADVLSALNNDAAKLVGIDNILSGDYATNLYQAKHTKVEKSKNKRADIGDSKELDVYDEMLTHAEIQGNINWVNTIHALNALTTAILNEDKLTILKYLKSTQLGIKNVKDENADHYVVLLNKKRQTKKNNNNGEDVILDKEDIQQVVNTANQEADVEYQKFLSVSAINEAIEMLDVTSLMKTLQHLRSQLPEISEHAGSLYMAELKSMKEKKSTKLNYDDINSVVKVLSAIANINHCIDAGDPARTYAALTKDQASITNLDEENADRYQKNLFNAKTAKHREPCDMLTHSEITAIIENTNTQLQEEHQRILAVSKINECILRGNAMETLEMLKLLEAKLQNVDDKQAYMYQVLLTRTKNQKAEQMEDENVELWIDDIQDCIEKGNMLARVGVELSTGIIAINDAVDAADSEALASRLSHPRVGITNVLTDCARKYLGELQKLKEKKQLSGNGGSGWMTNHTQDGSKFFFNKHTLDYHWCHTDSFIEDNSLLTKDEIQGVVSAVNDARNREILFEANEDFIIKVQAFVRGYLARKTFRGRLAFLRDQEPAVVRIQAFWRGFKQRKCYRERLAYLAKHTKFWVLLQAKVRMWLARKRYRARLKYFKDHEADIVKIQACVRSSKARSDYRALLFETNPPLCVVQRFVQLLDTNDADFTEELELQHVKHQVVKEIKSNQQLEHDLDQMEVKIGLLVKNQIRLQDVVMLNKKLAKQRETNGEATANHLNTAFPKELKSTSENHSRLEAYQQLFYLLQTYPTYLAKLIFVMPQDRTTKFIESVIYALFNYGSNAREEYLVTRLFKAAVEEIISRAEKITDIVTGNPLVIKMIVGFNRNHRGQNALKEMLQPLITDIINDKDLKINTNPIEVYKVWVNQQESETGKTSVLPYNVSQDEALKHQEVCEKLRESSVQLQALTERFLTVILQSVDKIPYNMRYMAKLLQATLLKKFSDVQEREILKIVGNLLYYRYINPVILAPDIFDIINVRADKVLTSDQRRNLGSVAKVLQYATSNKQFDGDSSYLAHMNAYIEDCHEKFKKFCILVCDVEEPEVKFNIDQYADVMMIIKPFIYLSMQEIVDTHQLLLEHQDQIAPESTDPLHELLNDLVEVPSGRELLGLEIGDIENLEDQIHAQLAKTEITLTLTNKLEVPEQDQTSTKTLLLRTKHMVVNVLACQAGDSLSKILETPATSEQEELHQAFVKKRDRRDQHAANCEGGLIQHQSISKDCRLTIEQIKAEIKESLQNLELQNVVSWTDDYQAIINLIAHDIRNQRRYRNNRKQELNRLRVTLKCLAEKRAFYEWQVDYYNQYVTTCTGNLQQNGRSHKAKANKNAKKAHGTIKYSGAKLLEKGIVLEIEGLSQGQFKNAQFEIAATATAGVFSVSAKFMGIDVEKVELVFQDLLQLQYEGVAIMEMFGRTKVNVNLLIFLINKKFYSGNK